MITALTNRAAGSRRWVVAGILAVFVAAAWYLELSPGGLVPPDETSWDRAGKFFSAALSPAMDYQDENVPDSADHIIVKGLRGLLLTLQFAVGAMSMAIPAALILGFLGSSAWWPEPCGRGPKLLLRSVFVFSRFIMSFARSMHELIWALLILSAIGMSPLAGMVALAIPFAGTLGKVFSEIVDEEARDSATALKTIGYGPVQTFLIGLLPRALPDLITYSFYRFECALRASAVLGFVGIETIGLYIELSHEEFYYNEIWTYLYLLLAMIVLVDLCGAAIRRRLNSHIAEPGSILPSVSRACRYLSAILLRRGAKRFGRSGKGKGEAGASSIPGAEREQKVDALWKARPRDLFLRWCLAVAAGLVAWAWLAPERLLGRLSSEQRWTNFKRFLEQLIPEPVQASGNWADAVPWAWELFIDEGLEALLVTLAIACAAIILASAAAMIFLPLASRRLARADAMEIWNGRLPAWMRFGWSLVRGSTRMLFVLTRAIPEYIIAFLLIALLGLQAWPLIIALAVHNFGILGRLWGEVLENADGDAARQAMAGGKGRFATFVTILLPAVFNRFLIYFFYRWETCIKDATVLGMLGLLTLGKLIVMSKGFFWDQMFFFVLLGSSVILIGDFLSTFLRRRLRRSA